MKTVVGLYDRFDDAQQAIKNLWDARFRSEDISLVTRDAKGEFTKYMNDPSRHGEKDITGGAASGAGIGAVVGVLGGLLAGLGALAIPGIGPVLAAGPIISALGGMGLGAMAGGIVGALVDMGVPEEHAQTYAESIRRGGSLVAVRCSDEMADQAMNIMNRFHPVDVSKRAETWRQNDWKGYNPSGEPADEDEMEFNQYDDSATGSSQEVNYDVMDRQIPGSHVTPNDLKKQDKNP